MLHTYYDDLYVEEASCSRQIWAVKLPHIILCVTNTDINEKLTLL